VVVVVMASLFGHVHDEERSKGGHGVSSASAVVSSGSCQSVCGSLGKSKLMQHGVVLFSQILTSTCIHALI
jgi:hypothetical protein